MSRVESARPDLVILDALLPGISGFDLCKRIKSHPELVGTLVVIITGVYLKDQYRRDALQSFMADGFVTKPCRPVELQRVVLGLLAKELGTTPLELGGRLKHPGEELPILEPEEELGWWAKLWSRITGTSGFRFDLSPRVSEDEPEEPAEEDSSGEPGVLLDESVEEEPEGLESTEGTVRLLPSNSLLSAPLPPASRAIDAEASSSASSTPERERAPRPEAIHRGVPIYGEEDFFYELQREVARCQRLGRPFTLILIRVTDLEQIVELVGSGFQRQLFWHVAKQALETLRQVDLAGHLTSQELVGLIAFGSGRYGGRRIVTRVQRAIKRHPFSVSEGLPAIVPALRFGIAAFPKEGEEIDALMAQARRELAP